VLLVIHVPTSYNMRVNNDFVMFRYRVGVDFIEAVDLHHIFWVISIFEVS
jgi:hypothetical protein